MRRFICVLTLFGMVFSAPANLAEACSCGGTLSEILEWSDAVWAGVVTEVGDWEDSSYRYAKFDVITYWKGDPLPTRTLLIEESGSSCTYNFQVGTAYVVFAELNASVNELWTFDCRRIFRQDTAASLIEELGPGTSTPVLPMSWGLLKSRYSE